MGQQQLLLLVLGIVIVGLAVVAGINAFQENQDKSQKDAIVNEGMRIATDVQSHKLKPSQLGGGVNSSTDLATIVSGASGDTYTTPWGTIKANDDLTQLELAPNNTAEKAIIDIPADGSSPDLQTSGGTWDSSNAI